MAGRSLRTRAEEDAHAGICGKPGAILGSNRPVFSHIIPPETAEIPFATAVMTLFKWTYLTCTCFIKSINRVPEKILSKRLFSRAIISSGIDLSL